MVTRLANDVYGLLAANPLPESPPTWELLFDMARIHGAALKREVYERVSLRIRLEQEHHKANETKDERTWTNPNV